LLTSIPGIGGFLAAAILSECGDLRRFNEKQISSYIGVVPGIFKSGGSESNLGVTPRANTILRPYIVDSAWVAIRKDPEIQAFWDGKKITYHFWLFLLAFIFVINSSSS
jgi:transposase